MSIPTHLQKTHISGYAYHDVRSVNVVSILHDDQRKLVDLGSGAPLGQNAPLPFTLACATPEILRAW
jgi:hypothetical protein